MTQPANASHRDEPARSADGLDRPELGLDEACGVVRRRLLAGDGHMEQASEIELLGRPAWRVDWVTATEEGTAVLLPGGAIAPEKSCALEQRVSEAFARATWQSRPLTTVAAGRHWTLLTSRVAYVTGVCPESAGDQDDDPCLSPGVAPETDAIPPGLAGSDELEAPRPRIPLALLAQEFRPLAKPPAGKLVMRRLVDVDLGEGEHIAEAGHRREGGGCPLGHAVELAWESAEEEGHRLILRKRDVGDFPIPMLRMALSVDGMDLEVNEAHGHDELVVLERRIASVPLRE